MTEETKEEMEDFIAKNWDKLSRERQHRYLMLGFPIRKLKGVMHERENSIKQFVKSK